MIFPVEFKAAQMERRKLGPHRRRGGRLGKRPRGHRALPFERYLLAISARACTWFQDSHGLDHTGRSPVCLYDGANSNKLDLYHFPAEPRRCRLVQQKPPAASSNGSIEIKETGGQSITTPALTGDGPCHLHEVGLS